MNKRIEQCYKLAQQRVGQSRVGDDTKEQDFFGLKVSLSEPLESYHFDTDQIDAYCEEVYNYYLRYTEYQSVLELRIEALVEILNIRLELHPELHYPHVPEYLCDLCEFAVADFEKQLIKAEEDYIENYV